MERERTPERREREEAQAQPPKTEPVRRDALHADTAAAGPVQSTGSTRRGELPGAKIWVLPTVGDEWWAVTQEADTTALAKALSADPPILITPKLEPTEDVTVLSAARRWIRERLLLKSYDTAFKLFRNVLLSVVWIVVAIAAMRFPGEAKLLGAILAPLGAGFLAYTVLRHGTATLRWHNWRIEADNSFGGQRKLVESPLLTRLAKALALRKKMEQSERGANPDDELLDANAYRKLIKEGVTTPQELAQLGRAVENALNLDAALKEEKKIGDVARDVGIDTETAIFYRDLAAAASEISLDHEYASLRLPS